MCKLSQLGTWRIPSTQYCSSQHVDHVNQWSDWCALSDFLSSRQREKNAGFCILEDMIFGTTLLVTAIIEWTWNHQLKTSVIPVGVNWERHFVLEQFPALQIVELRLTCLGFRTIDGTDWYYRWITGPVWNCRWSPEQMWACCCGTRVTWYGIWASWYVW